MNWCATNLIAHLDNAIMRGGLKWDAHLEAVRIAQKIRADPDSLTPLEAAWVGVIASEEWAFTIKQGLMTAAAQII